MLEGHERGGRDRHAHLRRRLTQTFDIVPPIAASSSSPIADSFAVGDPWRCARVPDDFFRSRPTMKMLVDALLDRAPSLPPVPHIPLGSPQLREHVMRVYEHATAT